MHPQGLVMYKSRKGIPCGLRLKKKKEQNWLKMQCWAFELRGTQHLEHVTMFQSNLTLKKHFSLNSENFRFHANASAGILVIWAFLLPAFDFFYVTLFLLFMVDSLNFFFLWNLSQSHSAITEILFSLFLYHLSVNV